MRSDTASGGGGAPMPRRISDLVNAETSHWVRP